MNQSSLDLLKAFSNLHTSSNVKPTLMDIAGYPHHENVSSNILKFFFEPDSPHGLGTLLVDALLKTASISERLLGITVDREVPTESGKRLDLLLESDNHLVAIENKIFHAMENPWEEYSRFLDDRANEKKVFKFILALTPSNKETLYGFKVLTYSKFIESIRSLLGHYVAGADPRYLIFLLDFLDNIEKLQKGEQMNPETYKFFVERGAEIEDLLKEAKSFQEALRDKVRQLGSQREWKRHANVEQWPTPYCANGKLSAALVHDIKVTENFEVTIDTQLSHSGWEIQIFTRKTNSRERLKSLLQKLSIPVQENERFMYQNRFPIAADLAVIQNNLEDILNKIATSSVHIQG